MSSAVDDRLRAATTALAEHDHLEQTRPHLQQQVADAAHQVNLLRAELAREQRDVKDMSTGVMGFLASLAMTGELEREQREAHEAAVRLQEGTAVHDALVAQLAILDKRLAYPPRAALAAEIAAAREAKEAAMKDLGAPGGAALLDIAIRIESIDIELVPLEDAVAAGTVADTKLFVVLDMFDLHSTTPPKSLVGEAGAGLSAFHRAVDELGASDDTREPFSKAISDEDRQPWVDSWLKQMFGAGDRFTRVAEAKASLLARKLRLAEQLAPVRARRDELAMRRDHLQHEHDRLLDPA